MIRTCVLLLYVLCYGVESKAQCEVLSRVYPDGSLVYSMAPVKFFWTEDKALYGNVVTDKENYFLALRPVPFPDKTEGKKIKEDLVLTLSNEQMIQLSHYDTQYMDNDSIMELMYLLNKKDIESAHQFEAMSVKIHMGQDEGIREYVFKLHKTAFQDQLDCFLSEGKDKKKE